MCACVCVRVCVCVCVVVTNLGPPLKGCQRWLSQPQDVLVSELWRSRALCFVCCEHMACSRTLFFGEDQATTESVPDDSPSFHLASLFRQKCAVTGRHGSTLYPWLAECPDCFQTPFAVCPRTTFCQHKQLNVPICRCVPAAVLPVRAGRRVPDVQPRDRYGATHVSGRSQLLEPLLPHLQGSEFTHFFPRGDFPFCQEQHDHRVHILHP